MLTLIFLLCTILQFTVAREFKFIAGSACKPYTVGKIKSPEKKTACGDDGFAIMDSDAAKRVLFAVSDGVGGWHRKKIDPGLFTDEYLERLVNNFKLYDAATPKDLIKKTAKDMQYSRLKGGSATSLVSVFDKKTGVLNVCNVGDCDLLILRNGKLIGEIGITQHSFNAPYQITLQSKHENSLAFNRNNPRHMKCKSYKLKANDIIIAGSDGLFDNVFKKSIVSTLKKDINDIRQCKDSINQVDLTILAQKMLMRAMANVGSKKISPFGKLARLFGRKRFHGGKADDTTVLIAMVG